MGKVFNVGMIGTGFMAKAHSEAYVTMPMCFPDAPAKLHLKAIADVNARAGPRGSREVRIRGSGCWLGEAGRTGRTSTS